MVLTELQKENIRRLPIEVKAEILHECADEFMTADEYAEATKMPRRTIYAKFGTPEVKGIEFCGHKLFYLFVAAWFRSKGKLMIQLPKFTQKCTPQQ